MSIIEEIKRDVRHDEDCAACTHEFQTSGYYGERDFCATCFEPRNSAKHSAPQECNCSHRRKIAFLERLEEPTQHMLGDGWEQMRMRSEVLQTMLKAAEEDLP